GTCLSYGLDEPYLPFRQILRQALGVGADSSSGIHEAVAAVLGPERAAEVAPMLGLVLGLPPASADAARITSLSGESLQQAVTAAVAELVTGLAERGPVAVVVDDFHWADAASLRLTEGLVDELGEEAPVLVLVAMRPESDRAGWVLRDRMLRRRPERTAELSLSSLDHDDVRDLVSDLVGEGTLPAELEATLLGRAEGNPFYLRELLRSLQDTGAVAEVAGRWRFDPTVTVEVPDTVERVVLARIDRLPPGDRDLLDSAAVIGREFDLPLLGRIAGVELAESSLSGLTRLGLFERSTATGYRFSHPLIQETAYSSMLRRGRAELHGRAAEAIEKLVENGAVEHHAVLARHHSAAGHVAEAVRYHRLAALSAMRVVALDEAVIQLDLAVVAAGALDPGAARAQLPELHLLRGRLRGRTGSYDRGTDNLRQAIDGARAIGDEQIEMQALNDLGWLMRVHSYEEAVRLHQQALAIARRVGDPAAQVTALSRMSMIHLNQLRLDVGLSQAEEAIGIARASGQDPLLGTALDCLKLAALQLGHLDLLERTVAEIIEVQERAGDLYLLQWAYIEGATAPLARGDLVQARDRIGTAIEINRRFVSDRVARALILEASSWIDRAAGDPQAAVDVVQEAVDLLGEHTKPEWMAWLDASLGSHLIAQGRTLEAITVLESALEHSDAIRSPNRALRAASHLAWARQLVGDEAGSRAALTRAKDVLAAITAPTGAVFLDGYSSYLAVARTCVALGEPAEAQELLGPLLAAARQHGWSSAERDVSAVLDAVGQR
ncbi:MAG: ATP-binding protein, partial [Marmoricola sp.]